MSSSMTEQWREFADFAYSDEAGAAHTYVTKEKRGSYE